MTAWIHCRCDCLTNVSAEGFLAKLGMTKCCPSRLLEVSHLRVERALPPTAFDRQLLNFIEGYIADSRPIGHRFRAGRAAIVSQVAT